MQRPLTGGPIAVANYSDFSQHSPILATLVSLFPLKTAEPWGLQVFSFFFFLLQIISYTLVFLLFFQPTQQQLFAWSFLQPT